MPDKMISEVNCGVCAKPLVYAADPVTMSCSLCGEEGKTYIYCPAGHYVCDECHSKTSLEVLRQILSSTESTDPVEIAEQVMAHPAVPMHGPEHHSIVPGAIVAAVRNTGYELLEGALEKALERGSKIPGGWCGLYGDCRAAVGSGIAVSVITGATPLTGKARTLAMAATRQALSRMLDEQPRCCKRASRTAIESMVEFLSERLGIKLAKGEKVRCRYSLRNRECAREKCAYYNGS